MAQRRFTGKGVFEDRDGNVLMVTTLCAEMFPAGSPEAEAVRGGEGGGCSSSSKNVVEGMGGAGGNPPGLFEDTAPPIERVLDEANNELQERVTAVWGCYVETMTPRRTDLLPAERKIINDALKAASADECCMAIIGCSRSAFHMGDNDRKRPYKRLSQILKGRQGKETTRERIDFFIDIYHNPTNPEAAITSEAKFKIDTLKDRVRRGNGDTDGQTAEAELWERYRISTTWQRTERGSDDVFAPVFERKLGGDQPA